MFFRGVTKQNLLVFLGGNKFWGGVKKNFLGGNNFLGMGKKKIFGGE